MPDFLNKAKEEEPFNNGGSTLGKSGSVPVNGPQSPLSKTEQNNTIANLSNQNTASYQQSSTGSGSNATPEQPCVKPKIKPYSVLNVDKALNDVYESYQSGYYGWDILADAVFSKLGFGPSNPCGCYVEVLSLGTLLGGVAAGFVVRRFLKAIGKYQAVLRRVAKGKFDKFYYDNQAVYEFTDTYTAINGNKITISFNRSNYEDGIQQTYDNIKTLYNRYKNQHKAISDALDSGNYLPWELPDLLQDQANLAKGMGEIASTSHKILNYNDALKNKANKLAKEVMTDPDLLMNDKQVQIAFSGIVGVALTAVNNLTLYRPKTCYGNATLNDNCECVCEKPEYNCGVIPQGIWSIVFDYAIPGYFPRSNELLMCKECGCNLEAEYIRVDPGDLLGECYCSTCKEGYSWRSGKNCPCVAQGLHPILDEILSIRGICIQGNGSHPFKIWAGDSFNYDYTCDFVCPKNSHIGQGKSCGKFARLEDTLGPDAPTTTHKDYKTGCNCVCDGREQDSSAMITPWPPVCPEGYIFDSDPLVCNCIDICSDPPDSCRWVVECAGCGDINECVNNPDCGFYDVYFRTEEFDTEAQANTWISENGHIYCVPRMVKVGTTTASGTIGECP